MIYVNIIYLIRINIIRVIATGWFFFFLKTLPVENRKKLYSVIVYVYFAIELIFCSIFFCLLFFFVFAVRSLRRRGPDGSGALWEFGSCRGPGGAARVRRLLVPRPDGDRISADFPRERVVRLGLDVGQFDVGVHAIVSQHLDDHQLHGYHRVLHTCAANRHRCKKTVILIRGRQRPGTNKNPRRNSPMHPLAPPLNAM